MNTLISKIAKKPLSCPKCWWSCPFVVSSEDISFLTWVHTATDLILPKLAEVVWCLLRFIPFASLCRVSRVWLSCSASALFLRAAISSRLELPAICNYLRSKWWEGATSHGQLNNANASDSSAAWLPVRKSKLWHGNGRSITNQKNLDCQKTSASVLYAPPIHYFCFEYFVMLVPWMLPTEDFRRHECEFHSFLSSEAIPAPTQSNPPVKLQPFCCFCLLESLGYLNPGPSLWITCSGSLKHTTCMSSVTGYSQTTNSCLTHAWVKTG